ncbi:MAG TPA: transposase [Anaerolineaceae bacterium]|nr:transposase [Anaerolineaceae bacterium]
MASKIIVATPHPAFGELIRQSLEEVGPYQVDVAASRSEALERGQANPYDLAILDSDIDVDGVPFPLLVREISDLMPGRPLVVIPPENVKDRDSLAGLPIQAFLNKPFYLPDLIETIEKLLPRSAAAAPEEAQAAQALAVPEYAPRVKTAAPAWLLDPNSVEESLERNVSGTSALAALLTRSGQAWAYTGSLVNSSADELLDCLTHGWDSHSGNDLARFVRLGTPGRQYMLFATCLAGDLTLALLYEAMTPFSKIRGQAAKLSRALLVEPPPPEAPPTTPAEDLTAAGFGEAQAKETAPEDAGEIYDLNHGWEEGVEPLPLNLPPLLEDVPPPDPEGFPRRALDAAPPANEAGAGVSAGSWVNEASGQPTDALAREDLFPARDAADPKEEEEPISQPPVPVAGYEWIAEPPELEEQAYTFILVPRLPTHYLTGEVARQLSESLPKFCQDFGWKLEGLSVRPNFLQWSLKLPRGTTPDSAAKIVRLQTSRRLFEAFPPLQAESTSTTQFWAPGYLILSGVQTASPQLVREFITQSREKLRAD